jgi:hypothetical protein
MTLAGLRRTCLLLTVSVGAAGCLFEPGSCAYESRDVSLAGILTGPSLPAGPNSAIAGLRLYEARGDRQVRTLSFTINGVLSGTIAVVEVRDTLGDQAKPLFTIRQFSDGGSAGAWSQIELGASAPRFEELSRLGQERRLWLTVRRSFATAPDLEGPLRRSELHDWSRPRCD